MQFLSLVAYYIFFNASKVVYLVFLVLLLMINLNIVVENMRDLEKLGSSSPLICKDEFLPNCVFFQFQPSPLPPQPSLYYNLYNISVC